MLNRLLPLVALAACLSIPAAARLIPDSSGNVFNKTTNPPTNDIHCDGGRIAGGSVLAYTEVCQDYLGDLIATSTSGTQSLGTSALPWLGLYNSGTQVSGTVGTTTAGTGVGGTAATQSITSGLTVFTKVAVASINVSTIVPVNSSYETVVSSGANLVLTSTPNISTTTVVGGSTELPSGTYLVLSSTSSTGGVTFQDAGTLTGSQLELGSTTRLVDQYNTLTLIYDATDHKWREISFGSN